MSPQLSPRLHCCLRVSAANPCFALFLSPTDQIQTDAFLEQPALRFLNISSNRIRKFQFGAFTGLAKLKRLYMAYNKIQQASHLCQTFLCQVTIIP